MVRAQYSYWLTLAAVSGRLLDAAEAIDQSLREHEIVPNILVKNGDEEGSYIVDPQEGSIEEIAADMLSDKFAEIARQFPNILIELHSINEEDHAKERLEQWLGARKVKDRYARVVGIENLYDEPTVKAAKERFLTSGMPEAVPVLNQLLEEGKL